ncbi:hypothetical protein BCR42DRAFT_420341 [Absidia repens]|uniref:PH domain-containing protein n=1 Tax=Absidia repens TaxID=90262 RepID=A0A1X2I9G2_9FUNG|nr:hypothetical protein BCR42DRAFT_420341 [Absidia repens]
MFKSLYKRNDFSKNAKEVPATVAVYEGHLYWWYPEKRKWKWHLFRFDGLSFIYSYTKGKVLMASHYQLPSWSLNLKQVDSISLLLHDNNNNNNNKSQQQQLQQCNRFCIRTIDKEYYILKARKHKDLDRWLFTLMKAWNWVQFEQHIVHRLPSTPPQLPPLNISSFGNKSRKSTEPPTPPTPPTPSIPQLELREQQHDCHPILPAEKEKWIHEWRKSLQPMAIPLCHKTRHSTTSLILHDPSEPVYNSRHSQPHPASAMDIAYVKVKKKPSYEMQNWIPGNYQEHENYDVHYFQDANTTDHANDTSSKHSGDVQQLQQSSLHYHRSSRGKSVQIFNNDHHKGQQFNLHVSSLTPPFDQHSPLSELSKIESTDDVYKLLQQQRSSASSLSTIQLKEKQQQQLPRSSTRTSNNNVYHPHRVPISPVGPAAPTLPPSQPTTYSLYGSTTAMNPLKKHLPFMKSSSSTTIGRGSFNSGSFPSNNRTPFGRSRTSLHSLV